MEPLLGFLGGNGGRWLMGIVGVVLILWTWDVPQRFWCYLRALPLRDFAREAAVLRDEFRAIRERWPRSPVSLYPLHLSWRPFPNETNLPADIDAGVRWIHNLRAHASKLQQRPRGERTPLERRMAAWEAQRIGQEMTGQQLAELLDEHLEWMRGKQSRRSGPFPIGAVFSAPPSRRSRYWHRGNSGRGK
jgi:hypothetical protein